MMVTGQAHYDRALHRHGGRKCRVMIRKGYEYMKSVCAVAVLWSRPREVNSGAGCQPLKTRAYCLFESFSRLLTNADGTKPLGNHQIPRLSYIEAQGHVNHSFRSYRSPNISGLLGAGTSLAAVSNVVVILRISSNREDSAGLVSQSVRHGDDLQRREFVQRDRSSIDL